MAVITYREALNQALREEMKRDDKVFILGEEVGYYDGTYKVTKGLMKEFGEKRVKDTPIAEEVIIGAAVGAAMGGLRPVAEIMTVNFMMLAMDQILNHASKLRYMSGGQLSIPMVIRAPGGGGLQLAAQHSQSLEVFFVHMPGILTVMASTPYDAKGLLKTCIRDDNPIVFLEHEGLYGLKGEVPEDEYLIPLGQADVKRHGDDVTIVAYSRMVGVALEAAEALEGDGISCEVIDPRTLKPLDIETIVASVKKTGRAVVVEECWQTCGVGAEIVAQIMSDAFDSLDAPVQRVSGADVPMPYNRDLEQAALPNAERVKDAVEKIMAI